MMDWDVISVQPKNHLHLTVEFSDGMKGYVCFEPSHLTGVFKALKNKQYFNQVYIDHGVVTWPGELDLAPDAMYHEIKKNGYWILK